MAKNKIGIIGCGNMGGAILEAGLKRRQYHFLICEKREDLVNQIKNRLRRYIKDMEFKDISGVIRDSDVVVIAVKPQDIEEVLKEMHQALNLYQRSPLVISIAAGIKTDYLEKMLGKKTRIIRAMPNIAITVEEGITALKRGKFATIKDLGTAEKIFSHLGKTLEVKKEGLMDAVTAISGSGPAYVAYIMEAILKSAKELGLDKISSQRLVHQTFLGTLKILEKNNFYTEGLILKVTSKKGTTQKALEVFKRYKLEKIIQKAISAAYQRAKELSALK